MSVKAVARLLGMRPQTVELIERRALAKMRERLIAIGITEASASERWPWDWRGDVAIELPETE